MSQAPTRREILWTAAGFLTGGSLGVIAGVTLPLSGDKEAAALLGWMGGSLAGAALSLRKAGPLWCVAVAGAFLGLVIGTGFARQVVGGLWQTPGQAVQRWCALLGQLLGFAVGFAVAWLWPSRCQGSVMGQTTHPNGSEGSR